jgi:hypothetical protein
MDNQELARVSAGLPVTQPPSPELPVAPIQPLAVGSAPEPSVAAGATGLAWWDGMKYFWKRSASGGTHLAPQDSYVSDVLDRTDHYMTTIARELGEDDYAEFAATADLRKQMIQNEDAVDTSGVEGNAERRNVLNRLAIARKICGASAVSAEHRVTNEIGRDNGDVEKLKADSEGFFASDVEKRERWGFKAIRLEFVAKAIADGEIIPTDDTAFAQLLAKRIGRSLYDDAVERGNKLKRPQQQAAASSTKPTREELLAMTA